LGGVDYSQKGRKGRERPGAATRAQTLEKTWERPMREHQEKNGWKEEQNHTGGRVNISIFKLLKKEIGGAGERVVFESLETEERDFRDAAHGSALRKVSGVRNRRGRTGKGKPEATPKNEKELEPDGGCPWADKSQGGKSRGGQAAR